MIACMLFNAGGVYNGSVVVYAVLARLLWFACVVVLKNCLQNDCFLMNADQQG